jgi:hypothetical protein
MTCVLSRNGGDRRWHAGLRVHGEGALERLPQARVPRVAAAARSTARRDRRAKRGRRGRRRAAVRLRALDDGLARPRRRRRDRPVRQRRPELATRGTDDRCS